MISVQEYLDNKDLLEMYYTPYQEKCAIIDTIIDTITNKTWNYWDIDYAQLEGVKNALFVSTITNIDMTTRNEEDLLGYDVLCANREWNNLLVRIEDEYDAFEHILGLKLETLKGKYSTASVLDVIANKLIDLVKISEE